MRALSVASTLGFRAVLVHAIDDEAAAFYRKAGFVPSPLDPRALLLPVETLRQAVGA
jgi:hypothetical protein